MKHDVIDLIIARHEDVADRYCDAVLAGEGVVAAILLEELFVLRAFGREAIAELEEHLRLETLLRRQVGLC